MKLTKKQRLKVLKRLRIRIACNRCGKSVTIRYAAGNGLDLCLSCMQQELDGMETVEPEPPKRIRLVPGCQSKPYRLRSKAPWRVGNKQVLRSRARA